MEFDVTYLAKLTYYRSSHHFADRTFRRHSHFADRTFRRHRILLPPAMLYSRCGAVRCSILQPSKIVTYDILSPTICHHKILSPQYFVDIKCCPCISQPSGNAVALAQWNLVIAKLPHCSSCSPCILPPIANMHPHFATQRQCSPEFLSQYLTLSGVSWPPSRATRHNSGSVPHMGAQFLWGLFRGLQTLETAPVVIMVRYLGVLSPYQMWLVLVDLLRGYKAQP